jgi:hypothetical protein
MHMEDSPLPRISPAIQQAVTQRGLFLIAKAEPSPFGKSDYLFVCTSPDRNDCGYTRVGQAIKEGGLVVYAMNGQHSRFHADIHQIRGHYRTWDDAIATILQEFDRWGWWPER